jgi:hypothetical protein
VVRQRPAKPRTPVRIRSAPSPSFLLTFGWIDSVNPDGLEERTITEADIYEFSFVTFPQY